MVDQERDRAPRGWLVALEGVDGAGKTTLSQAVAADLADWGAIYCSSKQIATSPPFVEKRMTEVAAMLWPREHTSFDHLLPPHYWLHLQATWYSLLAEFVLAPRLTQTRLVIVDGWYFKFIAKLLLRGFTLDYLNVIFSHVLRPDIVLLLDVDVPAIWQRRADFRPHELGLHHDYPTLGRESFVDYQARIMQSFRRLSAAPNWIVMPLDAQSSIQENAALIQSRIRQQLSARDQPARAARECGDG